MKISEFILDWLNETALFEMAHNRKKAISIVSSKQNQIATHLIKVLAFDCQEITHWLKELDVFLYEIDDVCLKPNGKKLSKDVYYELLWEEPLHNGVGFISKKIGRLVKMEYPSHKRSARSDYDVYETCERILNSVCADLANNKFETIRDYV